MISRLLAVSGLSVGYNGANILSDVSFELASGSFLGLLGPNGAGKSTLLRCVAGFLRPCAGNIRFENCDNLRRRVAFVDADGQRPQGFTLRQYVLLGRFPWLSRFGFYARQDCICAEAALSAAGIPDLAEKKVETLSSGQWRLAVVARGLCQVWGTDSPLLLLDEPTANLDLNRSMRVFQLLKNCRERGWSFIAALHDCNLASLFCDRLLGVKNGKPLFYGPVREVFTEENISDLYDWPAGVFSHPQLGRPQIYARL